MYWGIYYLHQVFLVYGSKTRVCMSTKILLMIYDIFV